MVGIRIRGGGILYVRELVSEMVFMGLAMALLRVGLGWYGIAWNRDYHIR